MKTKIFAISLLGILAASSAFAAEFRFAHENGDRTVNVLPSENVKNLYAAGSAVNINGNITGDLFAGGGTVTVNGNVEKDLNAAGGNVTINGSSGDDARVAGGNITINGPVAGDLLVAGANINVSEKASIGSDLVAAGGSVVVNSAVTGKAFVNGGDITINGKVRGNLEVTAQNLTFGPNSEIVGQITYTGENTAKVSVGAKVGTINYTKKDVSNKAKHAFRSFFAIATLIKLVGLLVVGLLFYWLMPARVRAIVASIRNKTWQNLGIGLVVLLLTPILAVILCITVVGLYLALIVLLGYLLLLLTSSVFMMFYTGSLIQSWFMKNKPVNYIRDLIAGTIILLVLTFIPFIGWIAILILYLISLGGMSFWWYRNQFQE